MSRKFTEGTLFIASGNKGKIREIEDLFLPFQVLVKSAPAPGIPAPEETGASFRDNAEIKARYYAVKSGLPALADDSGLAVDVLDGKPGIYSARWAGETQDFTVAMKKIEDELFKKQVTTSSARFICALSLCWPDGYCETFEGKVEGMITFPPRGDKGFGYDPIFVPEGYQITFAEMEPEQKHSISHRADAFRQLIKQCF